jgi:AraC-like DNA-binding protein
MAAMHVFYQDRTNTYFTKITVNNCYPAHLHKEVELFYCLEGQLRIMIDGKEFLLNPGDISICFPNLVHSIESPGSSRALLSIIPMDFLSEYEKELLTMHPKEARIPASRFDEETSYLCKVLIKQVGSQEDLRITRGYLNSLIGLLLPKLELINNRMSSNQDSCKLILDYIQDHFMEDLTLSRVSKELGLSKYYISHIFSEKIKLPFPAYVNRERVSYAHKLLKNPELSITDICFRSGFNSTRTFYRAFQEEYHTSPLSMRKSK